MTDDVIVHKGQRALKFVIQFIYFSWIWNFWLNVLTVNGDLMCLTNYAAFLLSSYLWYCMDLPIRELMERIIQAAKHIYMFVASKVWLIPVVREGTHATDWCRSLCRWYQYFSSFKQFALESVYTMYFTNEKFCLSTFNYMCILSNVAHSCNCVCEGSCCIISGSDQPLVWAWCEDVWRVLFQNPSSRHLVLVFATLVAIATFWFV